MLNNNQHFTSFTPNVMCLHFHWRLLCCLGTLVEQLLSQLLTQQRLHQHNTTSSSQWYNNQQQRTCSAVSTSFGSVSRGCIRNASSPAPVSAVDAVVVVVVSVALRGSLSGSKPRSVLSTLVLLVLLLLLDLLLVLAADVDVVRLRSNTMNFSFLKF